MTLRWWRLGCCRLSPRRRDLPEVAAISSVPGTWTYTASSIEDLDDLKRRRHPRGRIVVRLVLPALASTQRADLERRISRGLIACGCNEGALAGLLYLVLVPLLVAAGTVSPGSLLGWAVVAAGFVVAMLFGKMVGLGLARLRLWRALTEAERAFLARPTGG